MRLHGRNDRRLMGAGLPAWVLAAACAAGLAASLRPERVRPGSAGPVPVVSPANAHQSANGLQVWSTGGGQLWVADGVRAPLRRHTLGAVPVMPRPDHRHTARLVAEPSAVQWRPPAPGQPTAHLTTMVEVDEVGRAGPLRMHTTLFTDHGELPVVSLLMDDGALLDPDIGIHVIGHAVMHPNARMRELFEGDGRWWKYPGNYMFRGRKWERAGQVQIIAPDGTEVWQAATGVRIHGNITRGFPQKSFRLVLPERMPVDLFGDGPGAEVLLLRAAGNDQPKAFLRDALVQGLCTGLPVEVVRAQPCVVYVNGAYWGVSYLQQRIDEAELARRHGLRKKDVAMVELEYDLIIGPARETARLQELLDLVKDWNGEGEEGLAKVRARMDVDGFITYMAAMLLVGNQDWPYNNVKMWRHTGPKGDGPSDGRWYFILADTDLALGAHASPQEDPFAVIERHARWPVAAMFRALMRVPALKDRFMHTMRELHTGDLSEERMLAHLQALRSRLAPEMPRHTARWRKPVDPQAWALQVDGVRRYVIDRHRYIAQWLEGAERP